MKLSKIALSLTLATALVACGQKSTEELLQSAQSYTSQNNLNAAVVELKSAVQQEPQNAAVRVALARVYLKAGDGINAAKEFDKALEFGTKNQDVAVERMRAAYLATTQSPAEVLSGLREGSQAFDQVKLYQSMLAFDSGDMKELDAQFGALAQSQHADVKAVAATYVSVLKKDVAAAIPLLQSVSKDSILYTDSLMLLARAHLAVNQLPEAITQLKAYSDATPSSNMAKFMLAEALVRNNQIDDAKPIVGDLLKKFPEQPLAHYLQSVIEFSGQDFNKAKEHAEKAITNGLTTVYPRIIAALANISLGLNAQALNHLQPVKGELNKFPEVEKAYAMLELQAGNTELATKLLKSQTYSENDLKMLASAAFELSRQGATQGAKELLEHVEQHMDKNVQSLATLGMMKMSVGNDAKGGIADLEQALAKDPSQKATQFTLAMAYLSNQQYDKLAPLTQSWKQDPETASMAHTFDAYAFAQQNKLAEAITAADEAIKANTKNALALMLKARIALQQNKLDEAKVLLADTIKAQPDYTPAIEALYLLTRKTPEADALRTSLEKTVQEKPTQQELRAVLGNIYLDTQKPKEALELVKQDKTDVNTRATELWQVQLNALQQTNDSRGVLGTAEEWVKAQPTNVQASLALSQAYVLNKQAPKALAVIKDLRKRYPDNTQFIGMEVMLQAESGNADAALATMEQLPAGTLKNAETLFVKARLLASKRDFKGAMDSLQQSYNIDPTESTTLALSDLKARNESPQAALKFLDNHFATKPKTPNLKAMYANLSLGLNPDKAEQNFLDLIKEDDENLLALNNLAYLYVQQGKTEKAKEFAEKAISINPKHPDVLDTYGAVLLKAGQASQAIEQFKKSLEQRPNHPEVLLNLAEAQIKQGDKAAAKATLDTMQNTSAQFQQRKQTLLDLLK